jgi:hypothetical protein
MRARIVAAAALAAALGAFAAPHPAAAKPYGSGVFGAWRTGPAGLPTYRYMLDEGRDARARQPELAGSTDAWHQVGNDHVVANAYNHGYVQLWSQDRRHQWVNRHDDATGHFGGGYGYLRVGGRTISTLYDDRPAGARTVRDFGVGETHRRMVAAGLAVDEAVYAPFGDDPLLLHDVTITNTTSRTKRVSWFEYWDVNPYDQQTKQPRGFAAPRYDPASRTLTVAQSQQQVATAADPPAGLDQRPLTIFAAALRGPDGGHATRADGFFGSGGRARPAAVTADRLDPAPAQAVAAGRTGATLFAFRAPLRLAPGARVTLRYAYGAAQPAAVRRVVARYRRAADPLAVSRRAWARWLPDIRFGDRPWLTRELRWDAYMVRSGATYEECRGRHVISQGGAYQYDGGGVLAYRDALEHLLPMIYADPALARDVLFYSAQQVPRPGSAQRIPYGMGAQCRPIQLGSSTDMDLWLLLAAAEYGLASRDLGTFSVPVRYLDGGSSSLWEHLRTAFHHQESLRAAHGGYDAGSVGDWSDLSPQFLGMTESLLITAQLAYVYPRLAQLADLRGDRSFAAELRASGARALATTRASWTARGWYLRGYAGEQQLGAGAIFGEPQPWAMLAGAPNAGQATKLLANIRRYLTGVGAPGGPSPIGSSQSPAADDPGVTEHSRTPGGVGGNNAVFVGGSWFAINGWLSWGTSRLPVPGARARAFDEFLRNTLAAHATAYPTNWNGILSVDDVCRSFYSPNPGQCSNGLQTTYAGQNMHQPAWSLFDAIKLAGIEPTAAGYTIDPRLPMRRFSLRLPNVSLAVGARDVRGSVTPTGPGTLRMRVATSLSHPVVTLGGRRVTSSRQGRFVAFAMPVRAGRRAAWAIRAGA